MGRRLAQRPANPLPRQSVWWPFQRNRAAWQRRVVCCCRPGERVTLSRRLCRLPLGKRLSLLRCLGGPPARKIVIRLLGLGDAIGRSISDGGQEAALNRSHLAGHVPDDLL